MLKSWLKTERIKELIVKAYSAFTCRSISILESILLAQDKEMYMEDNTSIIVGKSDSDCTAYHSPVKLKLAIFQVHLRIIPFPEQDIISTGTV